MDMQSKYYHALEAIGNVHGDTSRPLKAVLEDLQGLRDETELLIDAVENDISRLDDQEDEG